ncbi:MAG: tetratricopeptide (TPR) repeat protein [Planctomycetota bacterium]|jgi:tetratricopeptide (TPR) repeat protein
MTVSATQATQRFVIPLLLLLTVLPWLSSFAGGYVFDDSREIEQSRRIQSFTPLRLHFKGKKPVVSLTFALNYKISEFDTWSYHLFNLLIHLGSVLMLFLLVRGTLNHWQDPPSWLPPPLWFAFSVALLWGVHPLQTESVTYIVQRAESLMGMFYLLSLWAVMRGCTAKKYLPWFVLAAVSGSLGMGTKIVIGSLPVVAILYDRLFWAQSFKELLRKRWRGYALLCAIWLVPLATGQLLNLTVGGDASRGSNISAGLGLAQISPREYLFTQPAVLLRYIRLVFAPVGQCLDYNWKLAESIKDAVLPGFVILAVLGFGVYSLSRGKKIAFLILSCFLILTPTSSVIPINDPIAEHRMYLSSASLITLAAALVAWLLAKRGLSLRLVMGLVLVCYLALGVATHRRNHLYSNEDLMWEAVLEEAPHNGRAYYYFAAKAKGERDYVKTRELLDKSMALNPSYSLNFILLAQLETINGNYAIAMAAAKKSTELAPAVPYSWNAYGGALLSAGRFDEALEVHNKAIRIQSRYAISHSYKALALMKLHRLRESRASIDRAIAYGASSHEVYWIRGGILRARGEFDESIESFETALSINDYNAQIWIDYSRALEAAWRFDEAKVAIEKAFTLDKTDARVMCQLGLIQQKQGDFGGASDTFAAVARRPDLQNSELAKLARMLRDQSIGRRSALANYDQLKEKTRSTLKPRTMLDVAQVAIVKNDFALATELYQAAFTKDPSLADDLNQSHRYNAAWSAARAKNFDQALTWLRQDLVIRLVQVKAGGRSAAGAMTALETWTSDLAFKDVRGPQAPAPWQSFWQEFADLFEEAK